MGHTVRNYAYHKCCEAHCEYCAKGKQHQANVELARMLDQLAYFYRRLHFLRRSAQHEKQSGSIGRRSTFYLRQYSVRRIQYQV